MVGAMERSMRVAEGFSIGILGLELKHRYLPGNVQYAGTFPFPVLYQPVRGVSIDALLCGERSAEGPVVEAALQLQRSGVKVVVGACGSLANYQEAVAARLSIPAVLSILCEVPFLIRALPRDAKLGVVFASVASFTDEVRRQCGIGAAEAARIVAVGAERLQAFQPILRQTGELDQRALDRELVALLSEVLDRERTIGLWLLQCSDLPPCASAIREASGLPVFHMSLLIEHLHRACTREHGHAWGA
jgi:hypothetical protein